MEKDTTEMSVDEILADVPEEKETPQTNEEEVAPEKETQEEKPAKDKEFQSLEAQKLHYKEKAEKLEKQLSQKTIGGTNPMEVVKLAKALEGYSEDEVDFITRNSGSAKIDDIIKTTKDEWVKDAIEARRKKVSDSKKVPGSSSPDFSTPSKNYRDIAKMSKEEFRDYAQKQERGKSTGI